ncbi:MAG: DUF58 domain-containing protein [Phycisphaerales bacterium]|nr:DUF58 domain-containing protein [Phycisphaerales bacterium]
MVRQTDDYRKYLDPAVLAKIRSLDLRARLLVQGFISGMHHSPLRGVSIEFAEYRKYCQGDDLRHLDWKAYGRTDKHYVKQYEQETNLQLLLAVDCSESMSYRSASSPLSKRDYATTVSAAMAYLALQQSDAVALVTFDSEVRRTTRASNNPNKWKLVVQELESAQGTGDTAFRSVFDELAETLAQRHLIVILSDFLGEMTDVLNGIRHLRHRGHEPIVLHTLDRAELTFPFDQPVRFNGLEGMGTLLTEPRVMRERYLSELNEFLGAFRRGCHEQQADYELLDTSTPLSVALSAYLAVRSKRSKHWR